MDISKLGGTGLQLAAFTALLGGPLWSRPELSLVSVADGYVVRLAVKGKDPVWLCAEKSGRVRTFKNADTAIALCRRLGLESVKIYFSMASPTDDFEKRLRNR